MSKKTIFRAVLVFLIVLFSFLTWFSVYDSFWRDSQDYFWRILLPLISFLVLGILTGLWFLAEDEKWIVWAGPISIFVPFLFIFSLSWIKLPSPWNLTLTVALAFVILLFWWGIRSLRGEKESRFKISLSAIVSPALKHAVTAIIFLASIGFYFSPLAQLDSKEFSLPRPFFDAIFSPVIKAMDVSLLKNGSTTSSDTLSSEVSLQLESQKKNLSEQVYGMINQVISNSGKPFKKYIPLGITLSFFFALKIFEGLFLQLMILGVWVLWKILRFFGVLRIKTIKVDKEIIEI